VAAATASVGLEEYALKLAALVDADSLKRIGMAGGMAAKDAALTAIVETLGPDRAMSNFRSGRVKLTAGFDVLPSGTQLRVNHRPGGLWSLADEGRHSSGAIYPRNGENRNRKARALKRGDALSRRAVMTPRGPRALSHFGPSRGSATFRKAAARERAAVPKAAHEALQAELLAFVRR